MRGLEYPEVVKMLISAGANLDIQSNDYETALTRASSTGRLELVKTLIDEGACVSAYALKKALWWTLHNNISKQLNRNFK